MMVILRSTWTLDFFFFSLDAKKILYSLGIFWPCLPYVNSNEQFIG